MARRVLDRTRAHVPFLIANLYSQPRMARYPSWPHDTIHHFAGKRTAQGEHWVSPYPQRVVNGFQRERLLLTIPPATFKRAGGRVPGVEARVRELVRDQLLGIGD